MKYDINHRRLEIIAWAREHGWIIDPFKGMDFHIEDFERLGCCPCDKTKTRKACPCHESIEDINNNGKCLCGLFWTQEEVVKRIQKSIKDREEEQSNEQKRPKKNPRIRRAGKTKSAR